MDRRCDLIDKKLPNIKLQNWTSFKSIITPENKTLPAYVRNLVLVSRYLFIAPF